MGEWFSAMKRFLERSGVRIVHDRLPPLDRIDAPTWICTSAPSAVLLLENIAPSTSQALKQIDMLPVLKVSLALESRPQDPEGFGCLFHRSSGFSSLGVLYSSSIFPHRSKGIRNEAWILGGKCSPELVSLSDSEIQEHVLKDRDRVIGKLDDSKILERHIARWPRAFPHYSIELEQLLEALPAPPKGITLVGNYLGSLGLSQIARRVEERVEEFQV